MATIPPVACDQLNNSKELRGVKTSEGHDRFALFLPLLEAAFEEGPDKTLMDANPEWPVSSSSGKWGFACFKFVQS